MRRLQCLAQSVVLAGALSLPASAWALSCDEVMNMVNATIAPSVVAAYIRNANEFSAADAQCLESRGAPAPVVEAAQKKAAASSAVAENSTVRTRPSPTAEKPTSRFDSADTLGADTIDFSGQGAASDGVDEDADAAGMPPAIQEAVQARRSGKPATAAQDLYRLLRDGLYPKDETLIQYHLARSLFDLEMYHSAQHYFMEVVRKGPSNPYFGNALPKLAIIAEYTGNDYELLRIVSKIPPEGYPRQARNLLYYLMGRKLYSRDDLSGAAEYFEQVSAKAPEYLRAKYFEGIIYQQQGKLRSAVTAFREVIATNPEGPRDVRGVRQIEDIKDLATINIARIYFGLERFDNADAYYATVPRASAYWAQSLYERAWTNFWKADLNYTLGLLLTVESPYFSQTEFLPEISILRALTFFNYCEYADVERQLAEFEQKYKPMQAEISEFVAKYRDDRELWDKAYDAYFTNTKDGSTIDEALFSQVLRNKDLGAFVNHLQMMDDEVASIDTRPAAFKQGVGDELKRIIESDRTEYKQRAGAELLREMLKQGEILKSLLVQSEIIRFEVVDAQRSEYEFRSQNLNDLQAGDQQRVDFAVNRDLIYWPFNGEFWSDELGYYRYTEYGSCQ